MKITILYDNTSLDKDLIPDWGFSCLVETREHNILFDTGTKSEILLGNMKKLGIAASMVDWVFISHAHWDHTGGLQLFLEVNPVPVVIPVSCPVPPNIGEVIKTQNACKLHENIYSTGEMAGIEQSLIIKQHKRSVVLAGCSHQGLPGILALASGIGKIEALVGGLHGFNDFDLLESVGRVCPTHCTQFIEEIRALYPDRYIQGGAGKIIIFS